ncbi:MAG: hypothetical protein IJI97_06680 [Clostridia bacterium]|jgi:hypothetical protein|nr:hypothetical protein [Clostridia bacterium]
MELPHETIAQKMRDLGGTWPKARYATLIKALGEPYSEITLDDVMSLCATKYGFYQPGNSTVWTVGFRR